MDQNFLYKILDTLLKSQNNDLRIQSRKQLNQLFTLDVQVHQNFSKVLLDYSVENSLKMILIIALKNFFENQSLFNEAELQSKHQPLVELYTQTIFSLETDTNIINNIIDIILAILKVQNDQNIMKQYLLYLLENLQQEVNSINYKIMMLVNGIFREKKDFKENFCLNNDQVINEFLSFGSIITSQYQEILTGNEKRQQCFFDYQFFYLKILGQILQLTSIQDQNKLHLIDTILWMIMRINFPSNENQWTDSIWISTSPNKKFNEILFKIKGLALKMIKSLQRQKQFHNEDQKNIEFISRALQNFYLSTDIEYTHNVQKLISLSIQYLNECLCSMKYHYFFETNRKNIFNLLLVPTIIKNTEFTDFQDEPMNYLEDLDTCYLELSVGNTPMYHSLRLYINLCKYVKQFQEESLNQILSSSQNLIQTNIQQPNPQELLLLHSYQFFMSGFSIMENITENQQENILIFIKNNQSEIQSLGSDLLTCDLLNNIQQLAKIIFSAELINKCNKINVIENYLNQIFGCLVQPNSKEKVSYYKALLCLNSFSNKEYIDEIPFLEQQIRFNASLIYQKMLEHSIQINNSVFFNYLNNFFGFYKQKIEQNLIYDSLTFLFDLIQKNLSSNKDQQYMLEQFNLFEQIMTFMKMSSDQNEKIDTLYYPLYKLIFENQYKSTMEEPILQMLGSIIQFQNYTSSIILTILPQLHKIICLENLPTFCYFLYQVIRFTTDNFTKEIFIEIIQLVHPYLKNIQSIYLIFSLLYYKPQIDIELANYLYSMFTPLYNNFNSYSFQIKAAISITLLALFNITGVLNSQEHQNMMIDLLSMKILGCVNLYFNRFEKMVINVIVLKNVKNNIELTQHLLQKVIIFEIDNLNYLERNKIFEKEKKNLKLVFKSKKTKKVDYVDSSSEEVEISSENEESSDLVNFEKDQFLQHLMSQEIFTDPQIEFKQFINEFQQQNPDLYQQVNSNLMFEYRDKMSFFQDIEKVLIDQENGVFENRRILKIKRKKNNQQ